MNFFQRREKVFLNTLVTAELLDLIKKYAGLEDDVFYLNAELLPICIEALKCICNLALNCTNVAERCCNNGILQGILIRIGKHKYNWTSIENYYHNSIYFRNVAIDEDVKLFDLKILFILTALCSESRLKLRENFNIFIDYLSFMLEKAAENHKTHTELPNMYLRVSMNIF